jgi:hypothetical protein
LAELTRELVQPATIRYVSDALASELNRRIDDRPSLEATARVARDKAMQRLQRLVVAIEDGAPAASLLVALPRLEGTAPASRTSTRHCPPIQILTARGFPSRLTN